MLVWRCFLTARGDEGIRVAQIGVQVREQVCERMEVHDADDTTWGQSIGNSPVHRGDLSGGDKPQETANTGPDGNCIRGDRAAYHGAGCNPAQGRPAGLGSNCWIGGDARRSDCGLVAHAFSQTCQQGNVRTASFKVLASVSVVAQAQPGMAVPLRRRVGTILR